MTLQRLLPLLGLVVAGLLPSIAVAASPERAPAPRPWIDLSEYRTPKNAIKADPKLVRTASDGTAKPAGYLGVIFANDNGKPVIEAVEPESPAHAAGLYAGDVVMRIGDVSVRTVEDAKDALRGKFAGEELAIEVIRGSQLVELTATLKPVSRPFNVTMNRVVIGFQASNREQNLGEVRSVASGSGADKAGIRVGDVILKVDGKPLEVGTSLAELLTGYRSGDVVSLLVKRDEKEEEVRVTLSEDSGRGAFGFGRGGQTGGWDDRLPRVWTRPSYRLAVVGVEYPDVKHNPKITEKDWEESLFSRGTYTGTSATGQRVHGSMADYYDEISYGKFKVEGKFIGWVEVSKKRAEYSTGTGVSAREKTVFLTEVMDAVLKQKGADALRDFDGVFILYAGGRVGTTRGGLYWPHRSSFTHNGKRWPYFIVQEGGDRMTDISVFCHEFGHMLGLPDLYARPEVPGMEGVGVWCAMSQQRPAGQPQHFSAWCKEQLGWITPTIIDPRVRQKLVLGPVSDDPANVFKVIVRPDGSEYFLLENRQRKGFDASLPADGLLVWRVMPGNQTQKVYLEESHGVEGPSGPRLFPGAVPFPSPANTAFTPFTTPSSKSQLGGGLDVYITNIRRLPDGRVTFHIGYEYQ
jgi:M6 family metalloprotease-like protein